MMSRMTVARLVSGLAFGVMVTTASSAQTKAAGTDLAETYVTPDGYGLGKIIPGSVTDVVQRARSAMIRMKIVEEPGRRLGFGWRELRGKRGDLDVDIRLKSQSSTSTRVEVTTRQGLAAYDKGVSQQVLDGIAAGKK